MLILAGGGGQKQGEFSILLLLCYSFAASLHLTLFSTIQKRRYCQAAAPIFVLIFCSCCLPHFVGSARFLDKYSCDLQWQRDHGGKKTINNCSIMFERVGIITWGGG